jgi:hypothetical protein
MMMGDSKMVRYSAFALICLLSVSTGLWAAGAGNVQQKSKASKGKDLIFSVRDEMSSWTQTQDSDKCEKLFDKPRPKARKLSARQARILRFVLWLASKSPQRVIVAHDEHSD